MQRCWPTVPPSPPFVYVLLSVLLSAHIERFSVAHIRDDLWVNQIIEYFVIFIQQQVSFDFCYNKDIWLNDPDYRTGDGYDVISSGKQA